MGPERQLRRSCWPQWLCPIALLLVSWVWVTAFVVQVGPDDDVVAVVFPPWWSTDRTLAAIGSARAALVRAGGLPSIFVVQPTGADGLKRLREAGAWFTVDERAVGVCFAN
jgi:hypothetical protein